MAKYNVEFKVVRNSDDGTEITQVKRVMNNSVEVAGLVQQVCGSDGTLEYLTIRLSNEKTNPIPSKPVSTKPVVK